MRLLSLVATKQVIHLDTEFVYPPVPWRGDDWSAIDSNTFDADWNGESYVSSCPIGHGETEAEAIQDLLEQLDD